MDLKDFKLYNICVMRLRHQIEIAHKRGQVSGGRIVLESYCTSDVEEIIDIHELYDIEDRTLEGVMKKLARVAGDASLFVKEKVEFDFNTEGELCLYLIHSAASEKDTDQPNSNAA